MVYPLSSVAACRVAARAGGGQRLAAQCSSVISTTAYYARKAAALSSASCATHVGHEDVRRTGDGTRIRHRFATDDQHMVASRDGMDFTTR
jgi:hypothetical protein